MWIFVDILLCAVSVITTKMSLTHFPNILVFAELVTHYEQLSVTFFNFSEPLSSFGI